MRAFIRLSSRVINKIHIIEIIKRPNKYEIHMTNYKLDSLFIMSSGTINTISNIIEVCELEDKEDYNIITELIESDD